MGEYLTIPEAAALLGVTRQSIWRAMRRGEIQPYVTGLDRRRRLLKRREVEALGLPRPAGRPAGKKAAV